MLQSDSCRGLDRTHPERSSGSECDGSIVRLPGHDEFSPATRVFEIASILVASALLAVLGFRTLLLRPFRVHHLNPRDFLRRDFIDCNGDVAFLQIPMLASTLFLMEHTSWGGALGVFGLGLCGVGLFTNQFHLWAHRASPAPIIRWLQDRGLILGRAEHRRHHRQPHQTAYCITTGWCNGPLDRIGFFPRLERFITRCTGIRPRADYHGFVSQHRRRAGNHPHHH